MDKGSKRVTIKDSAQRCGVTANTVSRALRGDTRISEATLKKVQQMAQEMGYIRNNLAATMRSGRSNLISIIVDDIENPHYATLVHKMSAFLKENGYNTMTLCTQAKSEEMVKMANLSIANYVDGILYFPYSDDAHVVRMIQRAGIPLVLVDRAVEGPMRMWHVLTITGEVSWQRSISMKRAIENLPIYAGLKPTEPSRFGERGLRTGLRSTG